MPNPNDNKRSAAILKYTSLGTQLLVMLGLGVWGGLKLDQWIQVKALFVILLPVIALAYFLWKLIRTLNQPEL